MADSKTVKIRLPRASSADEKDVFVGVNGKGWRLERGVELEVPACVAEALRNAELAEDNLEQFLSNTAE